MGTAGKEGLSAQLPQRVEGQETRFPVTSLLHAHPKPRFSQSLLTRTHPSPNTLRKSFMSKFSFLAAERRHIRCSVQVLSVSRQGRLERL